jgi:3-deoxy-D-manno-octulosonic-acid transferase
VLKLYSLAIQCFTLLVPVIGLFNPKARLWAKGRRQWRLRLKEWRAQHSGEVIWMHCASLGEFEQGRLVLEVLRAKHPRKKLLLTFFSPSGYEVRKHYNGVDGVFYLPADTSSNARDFISILQPSMVLMVKYEYWPNFFLSSKQQGIPLYIISGIFREDQRFFGLFTGFWRSVLASVNHFFVQNESSVKLLHAIGFTNVTLAGDTRFDRVVQLAHQPKALDFLETFKGSGVLMVGGSTWPADEEILLKWLSAAPVNAKLVVVPHEVGKESILRLSRLFPNAALWSQRETNSVTTARVLIVDEIGWLSSIYAYADVCWIGGGFGTGIHNTLEAAVWNKPVVFGPRHQKFDEAVGLIACGAALGARDVPAALQILQKLAVDAGMRSRMGRQAGVFVEQGAGATAKILNELELN